MEKINLTTKDNIKIALNYYHKDNNSVVILAPGWCMTKDSNAFKKIAQKFSVHFDVISFDFRGHGKSDGWYTFTAVELIDIDTIVRFARKKKYENIYLAGFSLGAALTLIYASKSNKIDKVIAVSAPSDFSKIENHMWKKEAWAETFKKFELDRFLSVRPYPLPLKKIKPIDIIDKIKAPALFIAGDKDPTVYPWHTESLYNKAQCKKKYKLFENGIHAEDIFLRFEDEFSKLCIDWLKEEI